MAKTDKDQRRTTQQRMSKLSRKLRDAYERHEQELVRGQQKVERTRLRTGKRLAKIAQRVARLTEALEEAKADAENAVRREKRDNSTKRRVSQPGALQQEHEITSPSAAADAIEHVAMEHRVESSSDSPLIVPESVERASTVDKT